MVVTIKPYTTLNRLRVYSRPTRIYKTRMFPVMAMADEKVLSRGHDPVYIVRIAGVEYIVPKRDVIEVGDVTDKQYRRRR